MFKNLFALFSKDIGIDLGTTNARIYVKGRGLVFNEPSIVAINARTNQIIALGLMAVKMIGKSPAHIFTVKPLVHGVVSDFEVAEKMLRLIIERIHRDTAAFFPRPRVVVAVPLDVTEVEKKSVEDVVLRAGAREVLLIERPMAAAIGARLPIHESIGNLIIEIGGGLAEVAVISLSGVVTWKSLKIGGETLNKNIIQYVREKFNILLGEQTAEELKVKIGSASSLEKPQEMKVRGRDLVTGLPKEISISDTQVREAIMSVLKIIVEAAGDTIEKTPPELVADIYERGLLLSGGTALLRGLDKLVQKRINVPIHIVDDPLTAAVRGTGLVLEDFENLKSVIVPSARD